MQKMPKYDGATTRTLAQRTLIIQLTCFILGLAISLAGCSPAQQEVPATEAPPSQRETTVPILTPTSTIASRPTITPSPEFTPTESPTSTSQSITPTPTPASTATTISELPATPIAYTYRIVNIYPHDRNAFTQGLVFTDSILYEGTGLPGQSTIRKVDLETGQVLQQFNLADQFFGEGITIFGEQLIQLTFQEHVGFVYDKNSFEQVGQFAYPTEGWGLTHDGQHLIMSDGTANLYFLDPDTFAEVGRVEAHDENGPILNLNELEYIHGEVYANVWRAHLIIRIDPKTGRVVGRINMNGLLTQADKTERVDVLNGIAYDAEGDRLFVTGKWWPKLFEIELVPLE